MKSSDNEIRRHYYLNRYVIIAPSRKLRPDSFAGVAAAHTTETPTSPAIELDSSIFEIKDESGKWAVKVVDNLFPALTLDNPKSYGKHEIIVETPEHNQEFSQLSLIQIERVFQAYQSRLQALLKLKGIRYVALFKNDGPRAGASIAHAHSQVMALPIVPPLLQDEADAIEAYQRENDSCPHCDVIAWEAQQKVRLIYQDKHLVALSPYAADYPFAVWVVPKRHLGSFGEFKHAELKSLAVILKKITSQLDLARLSFNFFLHESPASYHHHFYLKIEPRLTVWAGLELSTGMVINPVTPEYAALWYRGKAK